MQLRYRVACVVAAVMGVALAVMRLVWTPADTVASGLYTATLCVIGIAVAALFFLCGVKPRSLATAAGVPAVLSAIAAAWVGTALSVYAISTFLGFLRKEYPYPQPAVVTTMSNVVTIVLVISALLGGVFFAVTAARWLINRRTDRAALGVLALAPVVWTWARLLWYITSFASAVNRYRSVTETVFLLFEMLFLMAFARYVSGVEEKKPRFTAAIALCTAMLGLVTCVTRFGAYLMQDAALFSSTALVLAPDLAVALLAAAFVGLQLFAKPLDEPDPVIDEEDVTEPAEKEEDSAEFLLDVDAITEDGDEDEDGAVAEEDRRPLALEDIINDIINRKS